MHQGQATSFGALLRRYRMAAGLTQEELAERAGLSVRTVSDLERGVNRSPRKDTLPLLASALGLSVEESSLLETAARRLKNAERAPTALNPLSSPPLVGRGRELEALERHLACEGPPALLLAGEPGIGKSRLLQEAAERAGRSGWTVLAGGCHRRGGQDPYAPLLPALERYIRNQTAAQLRTDLRGCAWLVRLLPELTGGPIEPLPDWTLSPEQERRLMVAAVVRFLVNVAGPSGTLMVLDDLHWAGSDALDLLAALLHDPPGKPLRAIGGYRDTEVAPSDPLSVTLATLASAGLAAHHVVRPLAPEDAARLLAAVLDGADGAEAERRARVLRRAGGVPFFLLSCAEVIRLGEETPPNAVPWDVAQSVRLRVAALPATAQEVLGVAAAVGRRASRALLMRAATRPDWEVLAGLHAACHAGLLEESGPEDYRFVHDVIREVVEADLGAGQGALLHRDIALALEAVPGEPPVEALAYHYARAVEHARAGHWLEQAGDQAAAGLANAAALEHYTTAREHLQTWGTDAEALARLDEKLGDLRVLMGAYAQAQEAFARARAAATEAARRAELGRKEGITWHLRAEYVRALAAFATAEAEGREGGAGTDLPGSVRAAIEVSRGEVQWRRGQYDAAQTAAERALVLLNAEAPGNATDLALAHADDLLGRVAMTRGDTARAEACLRRSLSIYERLGDQQGSAAAWSDLSSDAFQRGDLTQAEERVRRSLTIYERIGDQQGIGWSCGFLSTITLAQGDLTQAEEYRRRALAIHERRGSQPHTALGWANLGQVVCERGDLTGAEECLRRALAILERSEHQGGFEGSGLPWNLLGTVAVQRGDLTAAEEWYRLSLDIMERLEASGFPGPVSYAWQGLGGIACERGDLAAAATWYRRARHLARRVGSIDVDALAALGLVRVRLCGLPTGARRRAATALLEQGCAVATRHGLALPSVRAALLTAEVSLRQGALAAAQVAAEKALERATSEQRRWEEGVARRLLGQCALARGAFSDAEAHLRAALNILAEMGAALEAARTRVVLAQALAVQAGHGLVPDEARALLAEATDQCAISGATLDLAQAEQLSALWRDR